MQNTTLVRIIPHPCYQYPPLSNLLVLVTLIQDSLF